MVPVKSFKIFGEPVDILISGEMTGGLSTTTTQTSPPGGGPPPHSHKNEDETFYILEGEYELLMDGLWVKAKPREAYFSPRGNIHTFRNCGTTTGVMLVFIAPSGMDKYLEELSAFSLPNDMPAIVALSDRYGITFAV